MGDKMDIFKEQAQMLQIISHKYREKEISIDEIPKQILKNVIHNILLMMNAHTDDFARLYNDMLDAMFEERNVAGIANLLSLLGYYLEAYGECEAKYCNKKKENMQLKSMLAYMKNKEIVYGQCRNESEFDEKHFQGKGVVYTAIMGEYDQVHIPQVVDKDLDYVLFTDNLSLRSDFWDIRYIGTDDSECDSAVKRARKVKILGYRYLDNYDYSIWIDGDGEIVGNIREYIEKYRLRNPIICVNHPEFDCVYQEAELCSRVKKDDPFLIQRQMDNYKRNGYPANNGLIASGFLVREIHNADLNFLMDQWWEEIKQGSIRDQLSFEYVFWKYGKKYDTSDIEIWDNKYIIFTGHREIGEK